MHEEIILSARNLHKSYRLGKVRQHVLRGVNLSIRRGEFVAVMGASGSGKSTLLHILGLLDTPDEGEVYFRGREVFALPLRRQDKIRCREIGFVFQFYHLLPELDVRENIRLPLMVDSSVWSWWGRRREAERRVGALLAALHLEDQAGQKPATLSGGERQRVAIARALIQEPLLLLADEPTGNLDSETGEIILEMLLGLNRKGQTILMVTHDAEIAAKAHRKLVLRDGKIR